MSNSRTSPVTSMNVLAEGREGGGGGGKGGKRKRGLEVCRRKRKRKREVDDTNSAPTINTKIKIKRPTLVMLYTFKIPEKDRLHPLVEYVDIPQGLCTVGRENRIQLNI